MRRRTPAWLRVVGYVFAVVFIIAGLIFLKIREKKNK